MSELQRIVTIIPAKPIAEQEAMKRKLQVAAYCRVSTEEEEQQSSYEAQCSYYTDKIMTNPEWTMAGIFADEGITGTSTKKRDDFNRMIRKCKKGKINLILTKSISRFARNTVTLLETVRELKNMGVDVFFEEQNIHSLSADGELMLTILASYAQEESLSASENQKWRIRRNFENGMPWNGTMLGYRYEDGTLVVEPTEAEIVSRIFTESSQPIFLPLKEWVKNPHKIS
mgnify:CR=1 FL=1